MGVETVESPLAGYDDSELALIGSICRADFEEFVKELWDEVPSAEPLIWSWHMSVLCKELQEAAERVFKGLSKEHDLITNISPGTSKSTLFSILFPAWVWTRMPTARFITASHTDLLALDLATKSRVVIKSDKYSALFGEIRLSLDQNTKGYFINTYGGSRLTCTVAGKSPMGQHGHFLIVDDPLDPKKAVSQAELRTSQDFFDTVLPTRKVNKEVAVTFLVMQRLHELDPSGYLIKKSKKPGAARIRHICLPAEIPIGETANVSPKELAKSYVNGLMDPVRLPRSVLEERKTDGAYAYASQFLQSPTPLGGGTFKRIWFNQRVKAAPFNCLRVLYVDRAATKREVVDYTTCRTACVLMARDGEGNFYIEHVSVGQWEPNERNDIIYSLALRNRRKYGPKHEPTTWIEREGGASGRDAWMWIAKKLAGYRVKEHNVQGLGNKQARAEPWACQLAAGNVYLVDDDSWDIEDFIREHELFPRGAWKDQVDASSGAFSCLAGKLDRIGPRILPIGRKRGLLRLVVCNREELDSLQIERHPCLLISFKDPDDGYTVPTSGGFTLLESLILEFTNIEPKEWYSKWDMPVPGYETTPDELIMTRDHGKKLWSFLTRKRDPVPEVFIFQDNDDDKAIAVACAVCDCLGLKRTESIYQVSNPDSGTIGYSNQHIYDTTKVMKGSIV